MDSLRTRQVHLDFHTSPLIPGVGSRFSKEQFQSALKEGNVNSITVFAKCHHGLCYYPTKVGTVHPTLKDGFDLTGAMVDAAHEIGVRAPIYITAGWSDHDSTVHPEWRMVDAEGKVCTRVPEGAKPEDPRPFVCWEYMCLSGDYARHIYDITQEICDRYPVVDGLFYDIVYLNDACYCPNCLAGMKKEGLDPSKPEDARAYYRLSHLRFMDRCTQILHQKHPEATIFFNSGGAEIYRPEYHAGQTHYEMEDLPTEWGGYNKMPPRASFMSRYKDKQYLGMTGKFHTCWGEFGGYKNPEALKYEALMMGMYGARCSIGDQMPPDVQMDPETYKIIGHAYRALEKMEPWDYPAEGTATLGVYLCGNAQSDEGLHSMLLEKHIDFELVMPGDDISRFTGLVLPDCVELSEEEAERIRRFIARGGSVLFNGHSAIRDGKFLIDAGISYVGEANYRMDYCCVKEPMKLDFGNAPFMCSQSAVRTQVTDGEVLAEVYEPWFDRNIATFCSHRNTPYRREAAEHPAIVRKGKVIYLAHEFCHLYKTDGAQLYRDIVMKALLQVYTPLYQVGLPSAGRTRLTYQLNDARYVFHAGYASPIQRGTTSVLEDMPTFYQVPVNIQMKDKISFVRVVPEQIEIPFTQEDGKLQFNIPELTCYTAVEICM